MINGWWSVAASFGQLLDKTLNFNWLTATSHPGHFAAYRFGPSVLTREKREGFKPSDITFTDSAIALSSSQTIEGHKEKKPRIHRQGLFSIYPHQFCAGISSLVLMCRE